MTEVMAVTTDSMKTVQWMSNLMILTTTQITKENFMSEDNGNSDMVWNPPLQVDEDDYLTEGEEN